MQPLLQRDGPSPEGVYHVPSLSYYCYRYLHSHMDSIHSLGDVPYYLCKPILQECSAEQLIVLEKNSPHIGEEDQHVWQGLCFRDFRKWELQYRGGELPEPKCWRIQYFACRETEEKRLEEVSMRIRNRREEVDQEKKERQVIVTDKLPPAKRTRFNPGPSKPKSLFEKTKAESIKKQRLVYGPSLLPPMSTKVIKPRPAIQSKISPMQSKATPSSSTRSSEPLNRAAERSNSQSPSKSTGISNVGIPSAPTKKDPMAALFMPKHKAHSQLPTRLPPTPMRRK